jgi:predicted nucleic acid-binding protein
VSFLLDTNVVSEWTRARPNPGVVGWLADADEDRLFLSVITFAELRRGVERLATGTRRKRLDEWLREDLPNRFEGRILPVNAPIADLWGKLMARREASGQSMSAMDGLIAATAEAHDLALVTRNTSDFEGSLRSLVNPWADDT